MLVQCPKCNYPMRKGREMSGLIDWYYAEPKNFRERLIKFLSFGDQISDPIYSQNAYKCPHCNNIVRESEIK